MTPSEYVREIVVPTVRDFRDNRRSRRHAYLACIVTHHIGDYLAKAGEMKKDLEDVMHLHGRDINVDVVHAICNAAKHCGHDWEHKVSFVPGSDYDRPPATFEEAVWDLSRWDDCTGGREIGVGGEGLDIYECVRAVLGRFTLHFRHHLGDIDLRDC